MYKIGARWPSGMDVRGSPSSILLRCVLRLSQYFIANGFWKTSGNNVDPDVGHEPVFSKGRGRCAGEKEGGISSPLKPLSWGGACEWRGGQRSRMGAEGEKLLLEWGSLGP